MVFVRYKSSVAQFPFFAKGVPVMQTLKADAISMNCVKHDAKKLHLPQNQGTGFCVRPQGILVFPLHQYWHHHHHHHKSQKSAACASLSTLSIPLAVLCLLWQFVVSMLPGRKARTRLYFSVKCNKPEILLCGHYKMCRANNYNYGCPGQWAKGP